MTNTAVAPTPIKAWQLGSIFVLAVLVFVALRWQPEPWIRAQVTAAAAQQQLQLDYQQWHIRGLTLELDRVILQSHRLAQPLMVEKVTVRPQLSMLWSGQPAARLGVWWRGQVLQASILQQDNYVQLNDIDVRADVAALQSLWQAPLAVDVSGQVSLSGHLKLDVRSGQPLTGHLSGTWQGAVATLSGMKLPLGDYRLTLQPASQSGQWQWQADGGSGIELQAEGKLMTPAGDPRMWQLSGAVRVQSGDAAVASPLVAGVLGDKPMKFRLSGSLLRPQLQPL